MLLIFLLIKFISANHEELIWRTETGYIRECGVVPNLEQLDAGNYDVIYTRKRNWLTAKVYPYSCENLVNGKKCGKNSENGYRPCSTQIGTYHCDKRTGKWAVTIAVEEKCYQPKSASCRSGYIPNEGQFISNYCGSSQYSWPLLNGNCFHIEDYDLGTPNYINLAGQEITAIPCDFKFQNLNSVWHG